MEYRDSGLRPTFRELCTPLITCVVLERITTGFAIVSRDFRCRECSPQISYGVTASSSNTRCFPLCVHRLTWIARVFRRVNVCPQLTPRRRRHLMSFDELGRRHPEFDQTSPPNARTSETRGHTKLRASLHQVAHRCRAEVSVADVVCGHSICPRLFSLIVHS